MSRALLHISKLDDFLGWLTREGIESRAGRGDYQVAQVKLADGQWACVYSRNDMPEHYTTDKRLDRLVHRFCNVKGTVKINPNEPALPKQNGDITPGLTKLEWAAVQIMAGRFASMVDGRGWIDDDVREAVTAARALFAELEKRG